MARTNEAPGARLLNLWQRLSPLPGGSWIFSRVLAFMVPYTGSIRAGGAFYNPRYGRMERTQRMFRMFA